MRWSAVAAAVVVGVFVSKTIDSEQPNYGNIHGHLWKLINQSNGNGNGVCVFGVVSCRVCSVRVQSCKRFDSIHFIPFHLKKRKKNLISFSLCLSRTFLFVFSSFGRHQNNNSNEHKNPACCINSAGIVDRENEKQIGPKLQHQLRTTTQKNSTGFPTMNCLCLGFFFGVCVFWLAA